MSSELSIILVSLTSSNLCYENVISTAPEGSILSSFGFYIYLLYSIASKVSSVFTLIVGLIVSDACGCSFSSLGVEKFNFFGIIFDVFIVGDVDPFLLSYVNKS